MPILSQETFDAYGYYPDELSKGSSKYVLFKCDTCLIIKSRLHSGNFKSPLYPKTFCNRKCSSIKPLIGKIFGRLTVIKLDDSKNTISWICKCTCGNITSVTNPPLLRGITQSCGCYGAEKRGQASAYNSEKLRLKDIGKIYNGCKVIDIWRINGSTYAKAICHCNDEFITLYICLKNSTTKSCGCLKSTKVL